MSRFKILKPIDSNKRSRKRNYSLLTITKLPPVEVVVVRQLKIFLGIRSIIKITIRIPYQLCTTLKPKTRLKNYDSLKYDWVCFEINPNQGVFRYVHHGEDIPSANTLLIPILRFNLILSDLYSSIILYKNSCDRSIEKSFKGRTGQRNNYFEVHFS